MNQWDANQMALELMEEFGIAHWDLGWDNSKSRFGCCKHSQQTISLSKPLTLLNTEAEVSDVIRHEIAHALAGANAGHGRAWKMKCLLTGARPERCYGSEVVTPPARWKVTCPVCGLTGTRHRKPRATSYHPPCGLTPLVWTQVA